MQVPFQQRFIVMNPIYGFLAINLTWADQNLLYSKYNDGIKG